MKGLAKCGLFALLFVASSIVLSTFSSDKAGAWSGSLNSCSETLPSDWITRIKTARPTEYGSLDFSTLQIVAGHDTSDSTVHVVYISPQTSASQFVVSSGSNRYSFVDDYGATMKFDLSQDPSSIYYLQTTLGGTTGLKDFDCIIGVQNPQYSSSYVGSETETLPDGSGSPTSSCNMLDIPCHLNALIMPPPDVFSDGFDSISALFSEKLGFLTYPLTFLADFFGAFITNGLPFNSEYVEGGAVLDHVFVGDFFGATNAVKIDLSGITEMGGYWTLIKSIVIGVTIMGLLSAFHKKYIEVIKS